MSGRLVNKAALITGGSSGIGLATAKRFLKEGASVCIVGRNMKKLQNAVEELSPHKSANTKLIAFQGDVTKEDSVKDFVEKAAASLGRIDIAFNNAGVAPPITPIWKTTESSWDRIYNVNVKGVMWCMKHEVLAMQKLQTRGVIINTSSTIGLRASSAFKHKSVQGSSKFAVAGLTQHAAVDCAELGIRVNAVAPGLTKTGITKALPDSAMQAMCANMSLVDRPAEADEVAGLVTYLASDEAQMVTGAVFTLDGGYAVK